MYQLFNMPPSDMPAPPPRRRSESVRSILIGLLVACVVVAGGITAFNLFATKAVPNLAPSQNGSSMSVFVSPGQSLTVDGMLVTLTSAQVIPTVATAERGNVTAQPSAWLVTFTLQFQNQTAQTQNITASTWTLSAFGGAQAILVVDGAPISSVAPHTTVDQSFTARFGPDGAGPYEVYTDATDANGAIVGWLFNG